MDSLKGIKYRNNSLANSLISSQFQKEKAPPLVNRIANRMIFSQSKDRITFSSKQSENIRRFNEISKKSVDSLGDFKMDSQQFSLEGTTA